MPATLAELIAAFPTEDEEAELPARAFPEIVERLALRPVPVGWIAP